MALAPGHMINIDRQRVLAQGVSTITQQPPIKIGTSAAGLSTQLPIATKFFTPQFYGRFVITGVTKDGITLAVIPGVTVDCFETATDTRVTTTVSDGLGAFTLQLGQNAGYFYCVMYVAGVPDKAGTTANTLIAVMG